MTYQEYQIAASRTCVKLSTYKEDARHMKMGVISEIGELVDAYKKELAYKKPLDLVNISEEWADVSWYLANEANRLNVTLDTIPDYKILFNGETDCVEDILHTFSFEFVGFQYEIEEIEDINSVMNQCFNAWIVIGKDYLNIDTNKALENNIAKLRTRYPEKFSQEAALNRDLDAERKELEK